MRSLPSRFSLTAVSVTASIMTSACITPPPKTSAQSATAAAERAVPPPLEPMRDLDAWTAAGMMGPGINIGNTLDNTTHWETGWGNPLITKEFVSSLKAAGFKSVRLPVAWDTYADEGRIEGDKLNRVREVVDWITAAGMFCVINIHWDGGWIDSGSKDHYPDTYATFSPIAEKKYRSYWQQISTFFSGKGEKVIFEALNEETKFENEGSPQQAYATLTRVNQLFIDTVRKTGGNNAKRLLVVTGYNTDITKTCDPLFALPTDPTPHRLFISVHYYTPWPFCGMTEDADWGKMALTWGDDKDRAELERLFGMMAEFSNKHDIPAFIGEFGVTEKKESASRVRYLSAVFETALAKKMVPVLWDTGNDFSRRPPYAPSGDLHQTLENLKTPKAESATPVN